MAVVAKRLGKGGLSTTSATLYTVPANTTTTIKAINICNNLSTPGVFSLVFAGTNIVINHSIKGNDTIAIPFIDQIIHAGETITGSSGASGISYYISGKEVT